MKNIIIIVALLISMISFSQEKKYTTYKVTDNETITSIAKKFGITPYDLLKLNPDAKNGINIDEVIIIPNKNFKANAFIKKSKFSQPKIIKLSYKDSIKDGILYHRVKAGETIYSLSGKYKVKKKKVLKLNKLKKRSKISLGQLLKFPTKKEDTFYKKPIVVDEVVEDGNVTEAILTYTVKAQDTKYSLARDHNISIDELEQINPQLKGKTLNEYDVIKLPTIITETVETISTYKTHIVQYQETFYKITNLYNVTKEELVALNSELKNGLKEGMVIKIPIKLNDVVSKTPAYKIHIVLPKETIFSLTQLYNVAQEKLFAINPELINGLKEGMMIKIPDSITEKLLNLDEYFSGKKLEVVLMLPFKAIQRKSLSLSTKDKSEKEIKTINYFNRITDFYLGATMALQDLKTKGLSVDLKVLDTKGDKATVLNLVSSNNFENTDLIIGPMHYRNVTQISKVLRNVPIISPIAKKNHNLLNNNNLIQNGVSDKQLQIKMLDFIKRNYANKNLIIITDEEKDTKTQVSKITNYLKLHDSIKKVNVLYVEDGYIKKEKFAESIHKKKDNCVILFSDKKVTTDIAIELSNDFEITLFAFKKGNNFKKIKNQDLNNLNFHFPTTTNFDESNVDYVNFNQKYKLKYNVYPSEFVYLGYDTTYDALLRIATYNNINDSFQEGRTTGVQHSFDYEKSYNSGYFNKGVFIVKYKDYQIIKVVE